MIKMVLSLHIKDKKVVLERDLIEKVKFIGKRIDRQLGKGKSYLTVVRSWKSSSLLRMYKLRKLVKYGCEKDWWEKQ